MADAQQGGDGYRQPHPPATSAPSTAKARTRQVAARYLQPKPPTGSHAVPSAGPLTGRPSLAAYGSAGWVELQHPQQAATPLTVPSGSAGPGLCSTARGSRARSHLALPTPAPGTTSRQPLQRQAAEQQYATPAPAATPMLGASTAGRGVHGAVRSAQQQVMQTPRGLSMSAAVGRRSAAAGAADRPGGFSADLTAAVATQPRGADGDMRTKLSAWREMKQQQQQARTAVKPGVFKEPAPKSTLFRATAATRANVEPSTGRKPAAGSSSSSSSAARAAADRARSAGGAASSSAAGSRQAASNAVTPTTSSAAESTAGSAASSSAFAATMATLQHSGGKPRVSRGGSSRTSSSKHSPVPLLPLAQAGLSSSFGSPAAAARQQEAAAVSCSPLAVGGSSTKIPKLDFSSLSAGGQQQQQEVGAQQTQQSSRAHHATQLSRRWSSSGGAGDAVLPDATPRSVRDAPPGRVPRTPRTATPAASRQQPACRASTPDGNDRVARQLDTSKPGAEQPSSSTCTPGSAKVAVPKLKLGAMLAGKSPGPDAAATLHGRPAHSCLSARGPGVAARGSAAVPPLPHGTPTARSRVSGDGGAAGDTPASAQRGKTPRAQPPAAAARLPTPRSLASSMSAASRPAAAPAPAAVAARKAEADKAEDVRQQLRLLRMQQLQLRHLNARMGAALQAKREKADASVAAAAAAAVDLSGQLLKAKHQARQATWQSQLQEVLQQQQTKLQAWASLQAQHQDHVSQLQAACSSALSHVPLLNGATVGHNPEQPDLQALQRQLQHGLQLLAELQPAMQLLMSGEAASGSSSVAGVASGSGVAGVALHPKGIKDTAVLSRDLMQVADDECALLQQLTQQLAELADLQLYVNSMQVQLQHMKQGPLEGEVF